MNPRHSRASAARTRSTRRTHSGSKTHAHEDHDDRDSGQNHHRKPAWTDYVPLIVVVIGTLLAAAAWTLSLDAGWDTTRWMHGFMGLFLVVFAFLKLFDLSGFADGFQMYDLLAKRTRAYALAYPFLEFALELGYLAAWQLSWVYAATIVLLGFGATGVISALRRGLDVNCACMGSSLKVPLSTVALVEDLGMAAMAAGMWLMA